MDAGRLCGARETARCLGGARGRRRGKDTEATLSASNRCRELQRRSTANGGSNAVAGQQRRGSGAESLKWRPRVVRRREASGRSWPEAGIAAHGRNRTGDTRATGAGERIWGKTSAG
jgi:hypothetical protein